MSMKNCNDTIWNRTLPACSAVLQPNAPPYAPFTQCTKMKFWPGQWLYWGCSGFPQLPKQCEHSTL